MSSITKDVTEYIFGRRSISFGNLCNQFNIDIRDLNEIIKELESSKKVRVVNSSCTLDCSSCSSCEDLNSSNYKETSIVVSLYL